MYRILIVFVLIFIGCGSGIYEIVLNEQDVLEYVDVYKDAFVVTDIVDSNNIDSATKDCFVPCNSGEICVNGFCVLIVDTTDLSDYIDTNKITDLEIVEDYLDVGYKDAVSSDIRRLDSGIVNPFDFGSPPEKTEM